MAWFVCPYKRQAGARPIRYCAMDDFTAQIEADGGAWCESEVLGNHAIVKVRARATTLAAIAATAGFTRLPKDLLTSTLSDLTLVQRRVLRDCIEALGYTRTEWQTALGLDLETRTLGDVLRFIATRRKKPRYDAAADTIVLDGPDQACESIERLDGTVQT